MASKSTDDPLYKLTGLNSVDLAETLALNPRAYMALKGAVAERHLWLYLGDLARRGELVKVRSGSGDFEKDFYVQTPHSKREFIIECKNVEVAKTTTASTLRAYFEFLVSSKIIPENELVEFFSNKFHSLKEIPDHALKELLDCIPQRFRESGLPRYQFSAERACVNELDLGDNALAYLQCFEEHPLSIDFQRTRNARDDTKGDGKMNRYYKIGELDVVAACLFSRTLRWEFIFCPAKHLPKNLKFEGRYSNRLSINPKHLFNIITLAHSPRVLPEEKNRKDP
ncbi:MAG: hypothetical protein A2583_15145 [Bdellovibrionales bacterium RIFOXYD1_FULL_53_11]|nr:MAG: hypothetical protein A2583_15145 [Bdellovibrionales bacterium RIFOXYD1_FULL_53_11]